MAVQDLERIEQKIDRVAAGAIAISDHVGGVAFQSMSELLEFAKLLSVSGTAIPKHLRGNPGGCLAVTIQALEWRMSPIAVANKSYEVNDRIAYESQLIHAVVEARAPLKQRLRGTFTGEGDALSCTVTGHFKGEVDSVTYESPPLSKITPRNSPLWKTDPKQQLWYYTVRAFARRYCPDVLIGIYSADELEDAGEMKDVTPAPSLKERLNKRKGDKGFSEAHVERETKAIEAPQAEPEAKAEPATSAPVAEETAGFPATPAEADRDQPAASTLRAEASSKITKRILTPPERRALKNACLEKCADGYEELMDWHAALADHEWQDKDFDNFFQAERAKIEPKAAAAE